MLNLILNFLRLAQKSSTMFVHLAKGVWWRREFLDWDVLSLCAKDLGDRTIDCKSPSAVIALPLFLFLPLHVEPMASDTKNLLEGDTKPQDLFLRRESQTSQGILFDFINALFVIVILFIVRVTWLELISY